MSEVKLYKGDCLEVMQSLIEEGVKVDMVLTDPPYGTTACKWDSVIPFDKMWEHLNAIVFGFGVFCLFGSEPFSSYVRMSNIKAFKYDWIWRKNKPTGFQHAKNMPLKDFEIISVFSNGSVGHKSIIGNKRMIYNPQGLIKVDKTVKAYDGKFGTIVGNRPSHKKIYTQEFTNYPQMVLIYSSDSTSFHPTQKPVALLEYLIKTYTNEGDTVLDFTMGSGSTGVACVNTGRNFIGIELDDKYFQIAERRISEAIEDKQLTLF